MIKLFIQKQMAVFSFAALIVIMGIIAYVQLPRESSPEIKQPYIFINTTYVGVSAEDIESLVTQPIEQELDGMDGVKEITSESRQSVSFIFVEFTSDVTVETALRRVKDRVDLAKPRLPDDAEEPFVREFNVSDWPVFVVVLSHPDGVEIIDNSAELFQEDLKRVNGVLDVDVAGRPSKELAIELDPLKLQHYGLTIRDVITAIQAENVSIPGGVLRNEQRNYTLSVTGEIQDPREFNEIFVGNGEVQVRLKEVGTARFKNAESETYSRLNGTPAITLSIKKRMGANILEVVDAVEARVAALEPTLPPRTEVVVSYDESRYIRDMLADLENNMATGFLLVLLVTVFFLGGRNSLFVSLAIPFSMLMSFFILQIMGVTLNMIVLFSLILALGMLVDNGIVIVENIFRHGSMGKSRTQAAVDGAREVSGPIIASTLTTCLAFFPIIFMPGIMGDFMKYLPITVIVVLGSSLVVALAINPTFCASFLEVSEKQMKKMNEGSGFFVKIQRSYEWLIRRATHKPGLTIGAAFVVVVAGFILFGNYGRDMLFFPALDPGRARVSIEAPQGTPLERTDEVVRELEQVVGATPASLENFESVSGRDGADTEPHRGQIDLTFEPYAKREVSGREAVRELAQRVRQVTGAVVKVSEAEEGPPDGDDVSYEVRGQDYTILGEISSSIYAILREYPQFKEINNDFEASRPEFQVSIDRGKAAHFGLSTSQIADTVRTAMNGATIGAYREGEEEYDIVVRYREEARNSLAMLRNLEVVAYDGTRIPLSAVAEVEPKSTVGVVKRRNLNRAVTVSANFDTEIENREAIIAEISDRVGTVTSDLPPGYAIGTGAGLDVRNESTTFLVQAFVVALFLIFIILVAQFNSVADPFIILFSVFLSLGGVFWGFFAGQQNFVIIMSGIGCIALAGVAVNNSIVLVDYTHNLVRDGMHWRDAIIEAGKTRLRPVLLTALTTVLALVPMAVGVSFDVHSFRVVLGSESSEYWRAFAWTMLYGLSFATVMTLVVVPTLLHVKYSFLQRHRDRMRIQ
ncbi:MAG: efflux RND transporter permease subunit [Alkalispirochaetaceae bacterium]